MLDNLGNLLGELNYLAVLVAALAGFVISALWYQPFLMGRAWVEESGFDEKKASPMGPKMLKGFIANLVLAFGLASFFLLFTQAGATLPATSGALWGFGFAVLIHGAAGFPNYVFEEKSVMLFLIHVGNSALGMAAMGAILVSWT